MRSNTDNNEVLAFGDTRLLAEHTTPSVVVGIQDETQRISDVMENALLNNYNSIFGYLGAPGIGKTTVLNDVKRLTKDKYNWVSFEAWRYSNRDELWINFTIEAISQLQGKSRDKVLGEIEQNRIGSKEIFFGLIGFLTVLSLVLISYPVWSSYRDTPFLVAFLKYAAPFILSLVALIGLSTLIPWIRQKSKLSHTFQYEKILKDSISESKLPLIVVAEDLDRCGNDGLIFLEALRAFINQSLDQKVIIFVPQVPNSDINSERSRSLKIYETQLHFMSELHPDELESFFKSLKIRHSDIDQLVKMTEIYIADYKEQVSLRLFKYALREASHFMKARPKSSLPLTFALILSRYIYETNLENGREDTIANIIHVTRTHSGLEALPFIASLYGLKNEWHPYDYSSFGVTFDKFSTDFNFSIDSTKLLLIDIDKDYEILLHKGHY